MRVGGSQLIGNRKTILARFREAENVSLCERMKSPANVSPDAF